jgi:hypothetical protein
MKLWNVQLKKRGTKTTILGTCRDKFKMPAKLTVSLSPIEEACGYSESTIMHGDSSMVMKTLCALAEIAWAAGWRPAGLEDSVVKLIRAHKVTLDQEEPADV